MSYLASAKGFARFDTNVTNEMLNEIKKELPFIDEVSKYGNEVYFQQFRDAFDEDDTIPFLKHFVERFEDTLVDFELFYTGEDNEMWKYLLLDGDLVMQTAYIEWGDAEIL